MLQAVPESERTEGLHDLNMQALPVERMLGVLWVGETDAFTHHMKQPQLPMTSRGMLGAISSVFDPLGLVTPFTIRGKMLIQDLTREKSGWDEPLSDEHLVR